MTELSAVHAELQVAGERLWVRDSHSSNGSFVNRKRIVGPTRVWDEDMIHFAKSEFVVTHLAGILNVDGADTDRTKLNPVSITHGQGYYFSKPAPVLHWTEELLTAIAYLNLLQGR